MLCAANVQCAKKHPASPRDSTTDTTFENEKRLDILTKTMKMLGVQRGGITWFDAIVRQANRLAQDWLNAEDIGSDEITGALPLQFEAFLQLMVKVDMSLSSASYLDDKELPSVLNDKLNCTKQRHQSARKQHNYAATINPTDVMSWHEIKWLLDSNWGTSPVVSPENDGWVVNVASPEGSIF